MARYFVHDLETDKLHVHTGGKADWLTLPEADRNEVKRACLWSGSRGCWVSRSKSGGTGFYLLTQTLKRLGFEDRGREGERLAFADQVAQQQERAEERADRFADRADDAQAEATRRFKASHDIVGQIPMGQPILVGHHSEKRHRAALAKSDTHMRKGCEASEKAAHYARRAEAAKQTAEAAKYSDPGYLGRRIKEDEATERLLLRRLEGRIYEHSEPRELSEEERGHWSERLAEVQDRLGFHRHCLSECQAAGVAVFNRETLKGKTAVLVRGRWEPIVRLNPTTVAVPNICFPTEESQRKWALKYPYAEVRDAR